MRDPNRIPGILSLLSNIWHENPDLRLGQLICNAVKEGKDPYYIEDEELIKILKSVYKKK